VLGGTEYAFSTLCAGARLSLAGVWSAATQLLQMQQLAAQTASKSIY
jgi:hypothetical protein